MIGFIKDGCIVVCDDCRHCIVLDRWQDAAKLGWAAPCDGGVQKCPACVKLHAQALERQIRLNAIADQCPLSRPTPSDD